jgi:diadenosine tetraphosphate (Ap4A) HIT family hydrolase
VRPKHRRSAATANISVPVPEPDLDCHICELNAGVAELPLRERLHVNDHWRVAHGWSSLPGWLIIALRRHAESLDELTADEAASLGPVLRAASFALKQVVACRKTYVMLFAEHPRYAHVHIHLVPRMDWFGNDDVSTAVFKFLNVPEEEQVPVVERERLVAELGGAIRSALA